MVLESLLGGTALRQPAGCAVYLDGEEVTDLYPFLTEVVVETSRNEAATATLRFETGRDADGGWPIQDRGDVVPGTPVSIEAVFGTDPVEVFSGLVRELTADYPESPGAAQVELICQDLTLALDRVHVRRPWGEEEAPVDDRAIVEEVLGGYPELSLDPESGSGLSGLVLTQDDTDVSFLRKRAEANGYELRVRGGALYFGPLRIQAERQPTILVYAGPDTTALSFSVRSDGHRPERVQVDLPPETGDQVETVVVEPALPAMGPESAATGLDDAVWRMRRTAGTDRAELLARAQREADDRSLRVSARGELDGSLYGSVLLAGAPVGVDGAGARLSGTYYVDQVTHRFDSQGYRQAFVLLRNAFGDDLAGDGGGLGGLAAGVGLSASVSLDF